MCSHSRLTWHSCIHDPLSQGYHLASALCVDLRKLAATLSSVSTNRRFRDGSHSLATSLREQGVDLDFGVELVYHTLVIRCAYLCKGAQSHLGSHSQRGLEKPCRTEFWVFGRQRALCRVRVKPKQSIRG